MQKSKAYLGVDPGQKGAFCLLVPDTKYVSFHSTAAKPMDIIQWMVARAEEYDIRIVMLEQVHAIFGTSAGSNFKFGYNVGVVNALSEATSLGVDHVTPKAWQKTIGCKAKGPALKKEVASIVERLYPSVNIRGPKGGLLDGRSDSLAIAHIAYLKYN